MSRRFAIGIALLLLLAAPALVSAAEKYSIHRFERRQLTDVYYSEGVSLGDINRDGKPDVVCGPFWFAGPDFTRRSPIYPAKAQPRERYADNFFSWIYDFNHDGWNDVLVVGFPGTPAFVYENPGARGFDQPWAKHQVLDQVSNESPQLVNVVGDEQPELVCTHNGHWGFAILPASPSGGSKPFGPWEFHRISPPTAPKPFGHGLGVGDVDGDGRNDIVTKDGWFRQPEKLAPDRNWDFHKVAFAREGGAEMHVYDVDGDGDSDVITSLHAHEFGLAWYEQLREQDQRVFRQHVIMGSRPDENPYGVLFSELHSVNLADVDGDGLKDIVTGKTFWSHHTQSPMWDAGAVVYWFRLTRSAGGVEWIPYQADMEAGIGRQIVVGDANGDTIPDILTGGMKGSHVLFQRRESVDQLAWQAAQPQPRRAMADGLSPQEAAQRMKVPDGFHVQLAAGEPLVHQPIAFTIDARGRVWVAEAYTYPIRAPEGQGKDKIIILEDTNRDGTLDKRTVFIEGLNLVSGLELGFGGVWVGAAPYLMFIPDANADDTPDGPPKILLDGFGYHDTHEVLNSFIWGPDGWLYGCHGVFTHSRVGKPGTPDRDRTPLNAGIWRYHPTRHEFDVFAWGTSNPWGVDFNEHGQAFATACVIPHLFHIVQGARYHRQAGQHFEPYTYDDLKTIADHVHYAGNIRDHAWWGQEPAELAPDTSAAGGGHAHCGAMIYLGDNWPAKYRNQIFFNNVHGNRVNCDLLERRGSGFVGRHGADLLLANDHWFRGISLKYGPNGDVYLIDWYDKNACHRPTSEIWDRTNGRIYRISYGAGEGEAPAAGTNRTAPRRLDQATEQELVAVHTYTNDWQVRMARRVLQERGLSEPGKRQLHEMLSTSDSVAVQLRALWTLHATGNLDEATCSKLLLHANEYLRAWSIQLSLEDRTVSPALLQEFARLAVGDPSPTVRLYLASAVQRIPLEQRWPILSGLLAHAEDAADHNLPLLIWYGFEPLVPANGDRALQLAAESRIPLITQFVVRRAAADNQSLGQVIARVAAATDTNVTGMMLSQVLRAFEGRVNIPMPPSWEKAYEQLSRSNVPEIRDRVDQIAVMFGDRRVFARMRQVLADPTAAAARRRQALDILVRGRDPDAAEAFRTALGDASLRGPAIRALAAYDDPRTPVALLDQYPTLSDNEKRDVVSTLVSRPGFAVALLDAMQNKKVPRTDLHAYHVRQLVGFGDKTLIERIQREWGEIRESSKDKQEQIAQLRQQLRPAVLAKADPGNGRRLFAKTCANCHLLFGEGAQVGPDITGSNRSNIDYILENIVDPSAVLGRDYRMTTLICADGRVVSGLVQQETDSALTVRTINDTVVVAKMDIDERKLSEVSLMPEKLLDSMQPDEIRDLVSYLGSPTQVPLKGPRAPIDPQSKRVPGAIEGESLKVLTASDGTASPQGMGGFSSDAWSGANQLWWTGAKPGSRLELTVPLEQEGANRLELVLTKARDYGIVQLTLDGVKLGGPIDLYNAPEVITTGVLEFAVADLKPGQHKLSVEIVGAHPSAAKSYMFGLDFIRWVRTP